MKIKLLSAALLATAGMLLPFQQSQALTFTQGDLMIGFRATNASLQGAGSVYVIDLNTLAVGGTFNGTAANFRVQTTTGVNLYNITNIGSDLTNIFGSNWNTRLDVQWGIGVTRAQGTSGGLVNGDRPSTTYLSAPGNGSWLQSTTAFTLGNAQRDSVAASIVAWQQGSAAQGSAVGMPVYSGAGNNTQGGVTNSGQTNSWDNFVGPATVIGFNDFGTNVNLEGNFGGGVGATSLDLYRYTYNQTGTAPQTPTWRGTFHISETGDITYAVTVPEPSSALLLGAAGVVLAAWRRRRA